MVHEQLVEYVKKALEHGQNNDQIRAALVNIGWNGEDIAAAFAVVSGAPMPPIPHSAPASSSLSLPSAIALWKQAWAIFRKRTGTFLGIAAVSSLASVGYYFALEKLPWYYYIILIIASSLVQIVVYLAFIYAADGGEEVGFGEAYSRALGKLPRAIWLAIITAIIGGGLMCYFYIPGIIVSGWFLLAMYVLALENHGGMNALFYSREYVRGKWWTVVGFTLLPVFLGGLVYAVLVYVLGLLTVPYAQLIGGVVATLLISPTAAIYSYLVYKGFKTWKGEVAVKINAGRKAKYIIIALLGFIIPIVLFGSSILLMMFAASGSKPLPNSTYTQPPALEKSFVPINQQNLFQK